MYWQLKLPPWQTVPVIVSSSVPLAGAEASKVCGEPSVELIDAVPRGPPQGWSVVVVVHKGSVVVVVVVVVVVPHSSDSHPAGPSTARLPPD